MFSTSVQEFDYLSFNEQNLQFTVMLMSFGAYFFFLCSGGARCLWGLPGHRFLRGCQLQRRQGGGARENSD